MTREDFELYLARFNAEDETAFDDYLCHDMEMLNGTLRFAGIDGMKHHCRDRIWPHFVEKLHLLRFLGNDSRVAVELWTRFTARHAAETLFGPVVAGDLFDYRGLIMYDLRDGKFATITVSTTASPTPRPTVP